MMLSGCSGTTPLTDGGAAVLVTPDIDVVEGCRDIGPVKGVDRFSSRAYARGNALWDMQNVAATMGADTVEYISMDEGLLGATIRGEAYHCARQR
jgi:hypothetical protein